MTALGWVIAVYLFFVFGHVLYIAIMGLARQRALLHPFVRFNAYVIILPVGYAWDAVMNLLVCLMFWRLPRDWLLTGTLKRAINTENNWRCEVAAWICDVCLNQFDPKGRHC
jgi:hypothetical protein